MILVSGFPMQSKLRPGVLKDQCDLTVPMLALKTKDFTWTPALDETTGGLRSIPVIILILIKE